MITTFLVNYLNHKNSAKIRNDMLTSMANILQLSPEDKLVVLFPYHNLVGIGEGGE